jgi:hypothetical protein
MTTTDNGTKPAGLDLRTLETDDTSEPYVFTHLDGQEYSLRAPGDIPWQYADALEQGSVELLLQVLLGDQYDDFAKIELPGKKLNRLLEAWGKHNGIDLGEFAASSGSSATTAALSRPTSVVTTVSGSRTSPRGG